MISTSMSSSHKQLGQFILAQHPSELSRGRLKMHGLPASESRAGLARLLSSHAFDDTEWRLSGNDARQPKARAFVEVAELCFGALSTASHNQHVEIDELAEVRFVAGGDYGFNQDQFPAFREGPVGVS